MARASVAPVPVKPESPATCRNVTRLMPKGVILTMMALRENWQGGGKVCTRRGEFSFFSTYGFGKNHVELFFGLYKLEYFL